MKQGLTSGLVLLALGLITGLLLAVVNSFTAPVILENENKIKYEAIGEFYDLSQYTISEETVSDGYIEAMYLLKQGDTVVAIVYSTSAYGYQSDVKMLIAVNSDLTIEGYKVVSQAETSGYGAQSATHDFNMAGVSISGFSSDNWDPSLWKQDGATTFDAISGATITSTAVNRSFKAVFDRASSDFGGAN